MRKFLAADWNQRSSAAKFEYAECEECALIFIERIPADLARYYLHEQYDIPGDRRGFEVRAASQAWKVDLLKALIADGSLFEIGPATGEFAFAARVAGFRPRLAEMNPDCCAFLRDVLEFDVISTNNPAEALFEGNTYDAICVWQAIEHIPQFWRVMERAAESLSAGGVLVVSTPNPDSIQARVLGKYWPHLDAPRHLYLIPPSWFAAYAPRYGLSVVMNTTMDSGSLGLNFYGWYLAIRNLVRGKLPERIIHTLARAIAAGLGPLERSEGGGCSYTIAFRKSEG